MTDGTEKALDDTDKDMDGNLVKDENGNQVVILGVKVFPQQKQQQVVCWENMIGMLQENQKKRTVIPSAIKQHIVMLLEQLVIQEKQK